MIEMYDLSTQKLYLRNEGYSQDSFNCWAVSLFSKKNKQRKKKKQTKQTNKQKRKNNTRQTNKKQRDSNCPLHLLSVLKKRTKNIGEFMIYHII